MTQRRSIFDAIEAPEPGWVTRKIKRVDPVGAPPFWRIELARIGDGITVSHDAADLYVAWARATEQAHSHNIGLFAKPGLEVASPLGIDGAGE